MQDAPRIAFFLLVFLTTELVDFDRADRATAQEVDCYTQKVVITFRDAASAEQAVVKVAPLFDDHKRAVSCRWDDNWTSDNLATRNVMEEHGIRGTWYLNDRFFSPESKPADYLPVAKQLLEGGNSVGGHSLTHPFLTYFHNNRMFAETSGVRIVWESALDVPVASYAYSFIDLRPEPEGREVLERSLATLKQAGYQHVAEYINFFDDIETQIELSPIMPPENNPFDVFDRAVRWAYDDARLASKSPMITNSMHAWYGTPRLAYDYDELRKRFKLLAGLEDVWHCNQNQYSAYRHQFREAKLDRMECKGNQLHFRITRPVLLSIDDNTPLTLMISDVPATAIESVDCDGATVTRSDRSKGNRFLFHLGHRSDQNLPAKIAHLPNSSNFPVLEAMSCDPEFPHIHGAISVEQGSVSLRLRAAEDQSLENVRVTWRTPIGWRIGQSTQHVESIGRDGLTLSQPLLPVGENDNRWGEAHFAAQVDFSCEGQPGRIHFTCQLPGEVPDDSLPRDGFSLLGPIPNEQWNNEKFIQSILMGERLDSWVSSDGATLHWRAHARDGYVNHDWLNPEYVRTMGTWDHTSPTYVMRSHVYAKAAQKAKILTSHEALRTVLVNGKLIDADTVELQEGKNEVVIVYPGCTLGVETQRLAGCFVRFADPDTGQRLRNIRYQPF